ncbi:MAG: hypothetical protein CMN30_21390 [Sandaracinus sp.]|nr:hypothetical protein [Sandaracinus sp.]|tara:strand:- start:1039 stop:1527 length:489 start_codon:yes stop_codon:yes gene_type:complete
MRSLLLPVLVAALLGACGGEPAVPEGDPVVELGTGSWRFEALEDGQEVELVRGAQGGWHVWISLRTQHIDLDRPPMRLFVGPADGSRPADEMAIALQFDPAGESEWRKLIGYTGIVNDPECLVGELVRFRVELDFQGETLISERDVRVLGGTYPPGPCPAAE